MNSPETQRPFIGSGRTRRLWPQSGLNDLLVFWHRSSWETCLHSQISHHLSPQNHTHAPLCQRAHSLHCCCAEDRPAVGTAAGFRALMQEQPHSSPVPKAAEAPRASPPIPARRQWGFVKSAQLHVEDHPPNCP